VRQAFAGASGLSVQFFLAGVIRRRNSRLEFGMTQEPATGIGKGRLEALADGVFAIALTLLILDIKVPTLAPDEGGDALARKLLGLWPNVLAFVVSFLIIGVFWVGHHALLHYVRRSDRPFLWMNLFFLLVISAMPFSAALLAAHREQQVAIEVYCGNLILGGCLLYAQLRYAAGPGRLFDADMDPALLRAGGRRILMGPALYTVALGLSFVSTGISLAVCALVPVLYILPGRVDQLWSRGSSLDAQGAGHAPGAQAPGVTRKP
jgi:uncharacterized membrane protein